MLQLAAAKSQCRLQSHFNRAVLGPKLRMSSIMRWRSGEMASDDGFMVLLLLKSEAGCVAVQRRQERQIDQLPLPPQRLPRERFSPEADVGRSRLKV